MALGRPLGAKLFLEGKEVPFIGATMTSTVGQASIAYIDVVPHQSIMNVRPRTRAEIFVRNYLQNEAEAKERPFPYILAWKGEVFGYTFGRTAASRTFSLSCIDHSSYWDNCLAYYFNPQQTQSGGADKASQYNTFNEAAAQGNKVITTSIAQASHYKLKIEQVLKDGGDFLDGVIAVYKSVSDVNEFYRYAEERLRIQDQIVMKSSGNLQRLLEQNEALSWFAGLPARNSGYSTLRMVLQELMAILFHDFVSVAFPHGLDRPGLADGLPSSTTIKKTIANFLFKPNLYMLPPPLCNTFFPDEYSSFQFQRNFFKEPTRMSYMPELPARFGQNSPSVYLPHQYEPPSFDAFMKRPTGTQLESSFRGSNSFDIPLNVDLGELGVEGDVDNSEFNTVNNKRKMAYNFLTNEEYIKGIWFYRESMVPATGAFRQALDDFGKEDFTKKVAKYLFYKRRFQDRSLQITSHLKMSVVPGFPVLILDDSAADQNVIAYCTSVTHRIYATEGGYTNVQLSYARYCQETDIASNSGTSYLIPPWFSEEIFGPEPEATTMVAEEEVTKLKSKGYPEKLSDFYKELLGAKGYKSITSYDVNENTVVGSVKKLLEDYRTKKKSGSREVMNFIAQITSRDYIKMKDYYSFFGAKTDAKDVESESWITFTGETFTRKGKADETAASLKNQEVTAYRDILKKQRGFRG